MEDQCEFDDSAILTKLDEVIRYIRNLEAKLDEVARQVRQIRSRQ